ncbi:MAG: hypothetical protein ABJG15_16955 [Hyphomonadaceae bacterium]
MRDTNQALQAPSGATMDLPQERGTRTVRNDVVYYDDTVRWPIWQSALFAVGVCGAFWGGVIYLGVQLFGG